MMLGFGSLREKFRAKDDVDICLKLLRLCGVAIVPGTSFYFTEVNEMPMGRFVFCKKEETLDKLYDA